MAEIPKPLGFRKFRLAKFCSISLCSPIDWRTSGFGRETNILLCHFILVYDKWVKKFEQIQNQENEEDKYEALKAQYLNGGVALGSVLEKLTEFDQSTAMRDAAHENLTFLYDPQIVSEVSRSPESCAAYARFLNFTEFHVGQRLALSGSSEAIEHIKNSLKLSSADPGQSSWAAYVNGTLMYLEGKQIPESVIADVREEINANVLRSLNDGLMRRSYPLYKADYPSKS